MKFENLRVVVTGASRYFGRALAVGFAHLGAEVYVSARTVEAAERTRTEVMGSARDRIHAFGCDLSRPAEIREFAARVGEHTDRVDLLVNNGARWLDGMDLEAASDREIVETIESTAGGTVLMVKHFLPLLRGSLRPDIVNMVAVRDAEGASAATMRPRPRGVLGGEERAGRIRRHPVPCGCDPPGSGSSRSSRPTSRPPTRDSRNGTDRIRTE